jgi:tellurite resistance protein
VSSETSFVSKQPKLERKLVSALAETRRLFRLFRFKIKTGSFGVSKQPKQTKKQTETAANLLKYQPF